MAGKIAKKIKTQFLTGIIVILPLGLTAWVVWVLFRLIGKRFLPVLKTIPSIAELPMTAQMAISAILTITVIWFIGVWARNYFGKIILRLFEKIVLKMPVVSNIYKTMRKITDTMFVNKQAFKKVALIEYPRRGLYTIVFVTNDTVREGLITVFVPSTPNPTTGYCIILPGEDVHVLSITVNQAMEFIFSGGMIVPENLEFPLFEKKKKLWKK